MGKIRRVRTKWHIEALRSTTKETDFLPNESTLPALFPTKKLFEMGQENTNTDKTADVNEGSTDKLVTKKDKRKHRHERFLKKLHASKIVNKNCKAAKARQKTVITGDLNPLTQALLDIERLPVIKPSKKERRNTKRQNRSNSSTKRLNAQISDMERFKQVMCNPSFKLNPLLTIDEHVRNVIENQTDKK